MLLDTIHPETSRQLAPNSFRDVMRARYAARRFKLSDAVVKAAGELIRDYPDTLLRNYQFAIPPYECTYIEADIELFLDTIGARLSSIAGPADKMYGVLVNGRQVNWIVQTAHDDYSTVLPQCYTIWDHRTPHGYNTPKLSPFVRRAHMLGSTWTNPKASVSDEILFDLETRFRFHYDKGTLIGAVSEKKFLDIMIPASQGDIRTILTFLLWINQPGHLTSIKDVPASRGWLRGKNIAYAAHHEIDLIQGLTRRKLLSAFIERASARAHQVRGFWRNYNKTQCDHEFPRLPDDEGRYRCSKCPQWRIWVREFERGDASKGYVTKTYKV